jgi:hypothetical protein
MTMSTPPKPDIQPGPAMGPSEFGGRGGLIQSATDGHSLTASEQAFLMRREGMKEAELEPDAPWVPGSHSS